MALHARYGDVEPDQREGSQIVIELDVLTPPVGVMALRAIRSQLSGVHVARAVAAIAVSG